MYEWLYIHVYLYSTLNLHKVVFGLLQHYSTQAVHATASPVVLLAVFAHFGSGLDLPGFNPGRARAAEVDGLFPRVEL